MPEGILPGLGLPWSAAVAVLSGLVLAEFSFFVTTVYLHRALAHRAITLSPVALAVCRILIWAGTGLGPASGWPSTASTTPSPTRSAIRTPPSPRLRPGAVDKRPLYRKVARDPGGGPLRPRPAGRPMATAPVRPQPARAGPRDRPPLPGGRGWEIAALAYVVHTVSIWSATGPSTPSVTGGGASLRQPGHQQSMVGVARRR